MDKRDRISEYGQNNMFGLSSEMKQFLCLTIDTSDLRKINYILKRIVTMKIEFTGMYLGTMEEGSNRYTCRQAPKSYIILENGEKYFTDTLPIGLNEQIILRNLRFFPSLKVLDIRSQIDWTDDYIEGVKEYRGLLAIENLNFFMNLQHLVKLTLLDCHITDFRPLLRLPSLAAVEFKESEQIDFQFYRSMMYAYRKELSQGKMVEKSYGLSVGTILQNRYLVGGIAAEGHGALIYTGIDLVKQRKTGICEYFPESTAFRDNRKSNWVSVLADEKGYSDGKTLFCYSGRTNKRMEHSETEESYVFFEDNNTVYRILEYSEALSLSQYLIRRPSGEMLCNGCGNTVPFYMIACPVCGDEFAIEEDEKIAAAGTRYVICKKCKKVNMQGVSHKGGTGEFWTWKTTECSCCGIKMGFPVQKKIRDDLQRLNQIKRRYREMRMVYLAFRGKEASAEQSHMVRIHFVYNDKHITLNDVKGKCNMQDVLDILETQGYFEPDIRLILPYFGDWPEETGTMEHVLLEQKYRCVCELEDKEYHLYSRRKDASEKRFGNITLYGCPNASILENINLEKTIEVISYDE